MIPTSAEVARRRWTAVIVVRCLAILAALSAVGPVLAWLSMGLYEENLWEVWYYAENLVASVLLLLVGYAGLKIAPWLARTIVPMHPYSICPGCRYKVEGLTEARCPECGLRLTREFLGEDPPARFMADDPGRTVRIRENLTILLRLAGLAMVAVTLFSGLMCLGALGITMFSGFEPEAVSVLIPFVLWTLFCVWCTGVLLFRPRKVARFLAPLEPAAEVPDRTV